MDKIFHVELQTPKRNSEDIEKDLRTFEEIGRASCRERVYVTV